MSYHFDQYELDTQRQELRRMGVLVKVDPLVFRVLAYLVQHRDRVVTKQELRKKLWIKSGVSNEAIARCILSVRQALGDDGHTQRFIRTMYGNGYRFVTTLQEDRTVSETLSRNPWSPLPSTIVARKKRAIDITIGEDFESYSRIEQKKYLRAMSTFLKTNDTLCMQKQRRSSVTITLESPGDKAAEFLNWLQGMPLGVMLQRLEILASEEERSHLPPPTRLNKNNPATTYEKANSMVRLSH